MSRPDVSFVVPVFNERPNLLPLVEEIRSVARIAGWTHEILLVDDGSDDGSAETIDRLSLDHASVRGVHLDRNRGQSAAFAAGLARVRGSSVVTLDGDGQNDPADAPELVALLAGYDIVIGRREKRVDGWVRRGASRLANGLRNRMLGERVFDVGCSLKAFRAEVVPGLIEFDGMHRFLPALARLRGLSWTQRPVRHRERLHGASKYGILDRAAVAFSDLLAVRWMLRRRLRYEVVRESGSGRGEVPIARDDAKVGTAFDR